ncbi:hypothetical protein [Streptomyces sp. MK5]
MDPLDATTRLTWDAENRPLERARGLRRRP